MVYHQRQIGVPMLTDDDLRKLYLAFEAQRDDIHVASVLAEVITEAGKQLYPSAQPVIRQWEFDGIWYSVDITDRFGRSCYFGGRQERDDLGLFLNMLHPGSVVWDIGANFGIYTVASAKRVGKLGAVFAAEPSPRALALLMRNIEANQCTENVHVLPYAISSSEGKALFHDAEETAFSGLSDTGRSSIQNTIEIETRRLDTVWLERGGLPIDMLKIDVEGHEADVLSGANRMIAESPNAIIQFELSPKNLNAERSDKLLSVLRNSQTSGFALWHFNADARRFLRVPDLEDSLPDGVAGNVFMVRHRSDREAELTSAADALARRPSLISTPMEEALQAGTRAIVSKYRERMLGLVSKINHLKADLEASNVAQPPGSPLPASPLRPALGRRTRPYALARISDVTAVVRSQSRMSEDEIASTIEELQRFCSGRITSVVVIVPNVEDAEPLQTSNTMMIIAPSHMRDSYGQVMWSAMQSARSSHIIFLDMGAKLHGSMAILEQQWTNAAASGIRAAGIVFGASGTVGDTVSATETVVGRIPLIRNGLIATSAIRNLGKPYCAISGRGFDHDLALNLVYSGFSILQAPPSVLTSGDNASIPSSELAYLEKDLRARWTGIFYLPPTPD